MSKEPWKNKIYEPETSKRYYRMIKILFSKKRKINLKEK